ncbi:PAS domain S-box protein, partial [Bacteriovoracaceae bacterium]|nr:PAS domain S-box protein [Bacteriovoracaceae bacterium]
FEFLTSKNNKKYVRAIGKPVFDDNGDVLLIRGIFQDITTRVLKENEIREKDQERMNILNSIARTSIVAFTDIRGIITEVNDRFCEISKFSREELIGSDHRILSSGEHPKQFFKNLWGQIKSGRSWVGEIKNKAKDGSFYWVHTTINPTYNFHGELTGYIAIRNDITEQKFIEEQLYLEKLKIAPEKTQSKLGQSLTGMGVAHEINNPLAIIQASTEIIHRKVISDEKKAKNVQMILDSVRRIAKIVNGLRKFSRTSYSVEFTANFFRG